MKQFLNDKSGTTAVIYALCVLPLMAGVGVALDFGRANSAMENVQYALDSSTLAATKDIANAALSDAEIVAHARAFFMADIAQINPSLRCDTPIIVLDRPQFEMTMNVNCTLPATISGLIGVNQFDFNERGVARVNVTKLDLALMLDVSGSMGGTKIAALQQSARDAVDTLITPETGQRVRIGLAPYATSVNLGGYAALSFDPSDSPVNACASERTGVDVATDRDPAPGRWIENDAVDCPTSTIAPLTANKTVLHANIDALTAGGGTAGHLGVAWSRYIISPEWNSVWPAQSQTYAYGQDRVTKAVILMTDGDFNTTYDPSLGTSAEQAEAMCDAMKTDGVQIFSVAFQAPPAGETILQDCASAPGNFFSAASNAELKEAYETIASKLSELRVAE